MRNQLIKTGFFLLSGTIIFMQSACVYYHQPVDVPLIKEKGDMIIDGGAHLYPGGVHSSVSYGFSDMFAIQGYGSHEISGKYNYYCQAALGYFKKINNRNVVELYAGAGHGYGTPSYILNSIIRANNKYYSQFNYGWGLEDDHKTDIGFSMQAGFVEGVIYEQNDHFPDITFKTTNNTEEEQLKDYYSLLFEPVFFIRFGNKHWKCNIHAGGCWLPNLDVIDSYSPITLGLSVNYYFNVFGDGE